MRRAAMITTGTFALTTAGLSIVNNKTTFPTLTNIINTGGTLLDRQGDIEHDQGRITDAQIIKTVLKDKAAPSDVEESLSDEANLLDLAHGLRAKAPPLIVNNKGGRAMSYTKGEYGEFGHEVFVQYPPAVLGSEEQKFFVELVETDNVPRTFFRVISPTFSEIPDEIFDQREAMINEDLVRSFISPRAWKDYFKWNSKQNEQVRERNLRNIQNGEPMHDGWALGQNLVRPANMISLRRDGFIIIGFTMITGSMHGFAGKAVHRFIFDETTGELHQFQYGNGTNFFRTLDVANNRLFPHLWRVGRDKFLAVLQNPDELFHKGLAVIPPSWSLPFESQALHRRIREDCPKDTIATEHIVRSLNALSPILAGVRNLVEHFSGSRTQPPSGTSTPALPQSRDNERRISESERDIIRRIGGYVQEPIMMDMDDILDWLDLQDAVEVDETLRGSEEETLITAIYQTADKVVLDTENSAKFLESFTSKDVDDSRVVNQERTNSRDSQQRRASTSPVTEPRADSQKGSARVTLASIKRNPALGILSNRSIEINNPETSDESQHETNQRKKSRSRIMKKQ